MAKFKALIFDCDGVLVDTEKDGHRVAFNLAFEKKGLDCQWDVPMYGELLKVAGGKERMRAYFDRYGWPSDIMDKDSFIKDLHRLKTDLFMEIIDSGNLPLRPGVKRLIDEAIAENLTLAVCTTSNERAVNTIIEKMLGPHRKARFRGIFAGDIVSRKKPAPDIYNLAKETLDICPTECVVIEDSRNGLLAAKAAGMKCIITMSNYTTEEDFSEADRIFSELGEEPNVQVTLQDLKDIVTKTDI